LSRPRSILLLAVLAALLCAGLAEARAYPTPPTGPWTLGTGAGFTLKQQSKSKVVLSNLHFRSPVGEEVCPAKAEPVKVLGTYALKQFHRGGYTAWGIGKNVGGEPGDMAAKLVVGGKKVNGSFHLLWNYADPRAILGGSAEFGECRVEFTGGKPK
jgi:hypothetical protein